MPETVKVGSIEAIAELRTALVRLREETQASVVAARLAAQAHREWLNERQQHWQRRVTNLSEELVEAEAALARCRSRRRSANGEGCQSIADWTERTRRTLWQAEHELRTVRQWASLVDERIAGFERRARVLTSELTRRLPLATAELTERIDLLEEYAR
ncbi:MAG TPA: hypothetical protein VHA53_06100 [Nitrolancea sp.]|jgi:hypothetical protein|nr:hypothetical protein [Nitrolancea sp.]